MSESERVLNNSFTGQRLELLSTGQENGGQLLIEVTDPPGMRTPWHVHQHQEESFEVLEGELTVWLGKRVVELTEGDTISVPRGTPHALASSRSSVTRMLWLTAPAARTEELMRVVCDLAAERARNGSRLQHLLGQSLMIGAFEHELGVLRPPRILQALVRVAAHRFWHGRTRIPSLRRAPVVAGETALVTTPQRQR